jgi:hypothetical protein
MPAALGRHRAAAAIVVLAMTVSGCGAAPASSGARTLPPLTTPSEPVFVPPSVDGGDGDGSEAPVDTSGLESEDPLDVAHHDAPEMESLLPGAVNGRTLEKESYLGDDYLGDGPVRAAIDALMSSAGKSASDFRVASAADPSADLDLEIAVYRVQGVDPTLVSQAIAQGWQADDPALTLHQRSIGGKQVVAGVSEPDSPTAIWYVHGTDVYEVLSNEEDLAAAGLAALP